jgi:hypothetical protein
MARSAALALGNHDLDRDDTALRSAFASRDALLGALLPGVAAAPELDTGHIDHAPQPC